ncbi:lipase-like PAD4 [Cryptomeria japonica]|uniref:lipase-like PAD4 n=1 Tax=Cryptomeria japonica TaxID=3369 RepID=UPI0027DA24D2|nr:lipase-like PAD4 [Cryptomeria japonica]
MGFDLQTTPRFSVGRELATLITSCGILDKAWEEICNVSKNNIDFLLKEDDGVAYVTFPSFSGEDFIVTDSKYGEYDIQNEKIFSACLKGNDDKKALVHKGAFNRFLRIVESSDFKAKMQGLKEQAIIFAGHSMGGAVATLATLWFLQKKARNISYFCITFGSPLVGNAIVGEAIGREDWTGRFCHVVSKYDIVPRMLLAPFESIVEPLGAIVPHWESIMGIGYVAVTHLSIPEACKTLLEKILQCTSTIANNYPGESGLRSPYKPFGTYMFCSSQGAACIDDSEAVLKMLHFSMQEMPFDQLAGTCVSDHTGYGQILETISKDLLNAMPNAKVAADAFEMGIALELEAMGVGDQNHHASLALRKAGEMKNEQDLNIEKLNNDLSKSQSLMAEVEWYKGRCTKGSGYYDTFKQHGEKPEFHVNLARIKLRAFWDEIVEKEEKHVLPSDFRCQNKWINAGTAYRRLVEPLDIAYYYRRQKDNKSYLSDGVRPHCHIVLEKWLKEKDQTRAGRDNKYRTKFASLTLDSCFWARIEEACQALTNLQKEQDQHQVLNASLQECLEFENYIWDIISNKSISVEVFLEQSSFMNWWKQYSSYLQLQTPQWISSSPLFNFMANETWK